jgi:hypothetical protein
VSSSAPSFAADASASSALFFSSSSSAAAAAFSSSSTFSSAFALSSASSLSFSLASAAIFFASRSFWSLATSADHFALAAGAAAIAARLFATPPLASFRRSRSSARRFLPAAAHVFSHRTPPTRPTSSLPSQQSHTPSFTRDDGRSFGSPPRLRQWKRPLAHADVPGSSMPSAQSQYSSLIFDGSKTTRPSSHEKRSDARYDARSDGCTRGRRREEEDDRRRRRGRGEEREASRGEDGARRRSGRRRHRRGWAARARQ